jgi:hypothetical protein
MLRRLWLGSVIVAVLVLLGWSITAPPGSSSYVAGNGDGDCRPQKSLLPMIVHHYLDYFNSSFEVEPNNSYLEANGALRSSENYQGYPNDQRDYFSFYVEAAGPIHITLNNHTGIQTQLQLFYQNTDTRVGFDPEVPFEIAYNGQPGWYYLYIFTGSGYNNTTAYTLHASFPVPPTPTAVTPVATPTCAGTAVPSVTPTKTPTPSATASNTPGPSPTVTQTPTASITPSNTPGPSPTPTETVIADWYEVGSGSASNGGISNNSGSSNRPALAVDLEGAIYSVWWDNSSGDREIYVRRWNGSAWNEVGSGSASGGGISNNSGDSHHPSVAIAPDGTPYIAWWDETSGDAEIYVRRWNGSSWEEVGNGSATGAGISNNSGGSHNPVIAVAPNGMPYVTWYDDSGGNFEIYVRRWSGTDWEEVGTGSASGGGISGNSGESFNSSILITTDGTPYVSWYDGSNGDYEIYVRHWSGGSWDEVGAGSASGGGISDNSGHSRNPSLAVAPGGVVYISWEDTSGTNREIYVLYWSGSNWNEVGTGSASGGGISNSSGESYNPSMIVAQDNTPYIAWDDDSNGNFETYVRRWTGSDWEEVGTGSASGGGISNTPGLSGNAFMVATLNSTPYVAWEDDSSGDYEIYILRWLEQ